jgi:hypothetical protein
MGQGPGGNFGRERMGSDIDGKYTSKIIKASAP